MALRLQACMPDGMWVDVHLDTESLYRHDPFVYPSERVMPSRVHKLLDDVAARLEAPVRLWIDGYTEPFTYTPEQEQPRVEAPV